MRNEIITENEKKVNILITSIFIFDKIVDGAQPEIAGEIASRRHILRTVARV